MQTLNSRSLAFMERTGRRYWWHAGLGAPTYVPPVYAFLTDQEWSLLDEWFDETDRLDYIGECQVPLISLLQGFIMGSQIHSIVQAGHYSGYSTLLMGFMLRRMNAHRGLFSVDIDPLMTEFTRSWVEKAGLTDFVSVNLGDSADPGLPAQAKNYFGRDPRIVFIDSSHAYGHTCRELELWYPTLCPGGLLICHDSADRAVAFDATGQGGVRRAALEWQAAHPDISCISIAGTSGIHHREGVYQDGCGVFIAQKPDRPV
ncbi:MAG TPA: class I SAM-dependent methyltransferase [Phycisphaerales bacterium]|nr:class I SAM-dependent methyltransferase [Phycisphaerales bacterium]